MANSMPRAFVPPTGIFRRSQLAFSAPGQTPRRRLTVRGSASSSHQTTNVQGQGSKPESCERNEVSQTQVNSRRDLLLLGSAVATVLLPVPKAAALPGFKKDLNKARRRKVPESEYKDGLDGLKLYDVKLGGGAVAREGERVVVHYEARWRGVTFMTSRQGMGVNGGEPLGFDVGAQGAGGTLRGLDLGVRGMRVGGQRKLLVPPNLAYGERQMGEIPPNSTLEFDVELLSIKTNPFGSRVKLVEG